MQAPTAFYAGTFDPFTNGHLDVLKGALALAGRVVVGIGAHPGKVPLFDVDERLRLIRAVADDALSRDAPRIDPVAFTGLAVDAAKKHGAALILRGIRDGADLDYEMPMVGMNAAMAPDLRTVFLPASPGVRMISGTLVRQIAALGGNVRPFVPALVAAALEAKFASRQSSGDNA